MEPIRHENFHFHFQLQHRMKWECGRGLCSCSLKADPLNFQIFATIQGTSSTGPSSPTAYFPGCATRSHRYSGETLGLKTRAGVGQENIPANDHSRQQPARWLELDLHTPSAVTFIPSPWAECYDKTDDCLALSSLVRSFMKYLSILDQSRGKILQITQRRIFGAKVIKRDLNTENIEGIQRIEIIDRAFEAKHLR